MSSCAADAELPGAQLIGSAGAKSRNRRAIVIGAVALTLLAGGAVGISLGLSSDGGGGLPPNFPPPGVCGRASLTLVQSTPVGDFAIAPAPGSLPTADAFVALADAANASLDLTAMYMDLLGLSDRTRYNDSAMNRFGAQAGGRQCGSVDSIEGALIGPLQCGRLRRRWRQRR